MKGLKLLASIVSLLIVYSGFSDDIIKIGFNYPETGPYSVKGQSQLRGAQLAVEEINTGGGILGKKIELVKRDSKSQVEATKANLRELIEKEGVKMVFGGAASSVAIAAGAICNINKVPFFGTLTYSTSTTQEEAKKYVFRVCYDSYAAAKVLAPYLNKNFAGKKFIYITADYTWGHTTEASIRKLTKTDDASVHKGIKTPFPTATDADFEKAIKVAKLLKPDVLVLVEFGNDMAKCLQIAAKEGLKESCQIVVPNITLGMARSAGPEAAEGVIGAIDWFYKVPEITGSEKGKAFVKKFIEKYNTYPGTAAAYAYTILYEYKAAAEQAKSLDGDAIVKALEGRKFSLLKDEQYWRDFDHQCIQTVYAVQCKKADEVKKDQFESDYFEIIATMRGDEAFITREEWNAVREKAGKPLTLE